MVRPLNPSSFSNDLSSVHSSLSLLQLCNYSFFNFMLWCNSPFFPSIRYTQESVQLNLTPTTQFFDFSSSSKTLHLLLFWVAYKLHRSNKVLPKLIHYPDSSNPINSNRHSAKHPFPRFDTTPLAQILYVAYFVFLKPIEATLPLNQGSCFWSWLNKFWSLRWRRQRFFPH